MNNAVSSPVFFVDGNALWHRRLAEALSQQRTTLAFRPQRGLRLGPLAGSRNKAGLEVISPELVPGWASRTALLGQRQLARAIRRTAGRYLEPPIVILTSPKYSTLAKLLQGEYPLIYYCADDYREYAGWGGGKMAEAEAEIIDRCLFSIFVSDALRKRAMQEYGIAQARCMTSPNATEPRFRRDPGNAGARALPEKLRGAKRPIIGILGGLSERLDLELVEAVAGLPAVGTLAIAGPVSEAIYATYPRLCNHEKVKITGRLEHAEMHLYAKAFDAALIPYAKTPINHYCSPMRLFDHLATGVPIFSTDACDQINKYDNERLTVAQRSELIKSVGNSSWLSLEWPVGIEDEQFSSLLWQGRAQAISPILDAI